MHVETENFLYVHVLIRAKLRTRLGLTYFILFFHL